MTVVSSIPVKMDDGATLFASVGYPTDLATGKRAAGTFPVLLTQNPYSPEPAPDKYFVSRGYIFVVAEVRGTGKSTGPGGGPVVDDLFGPRAAKDGVELVNWAAHQLSGSNGVIGLTGCSYLGISQMFTAALIGPHSPIAAMVPACASNGYETYFAGGIPTVEAGLFGAAGSILGPHNLTVNAANGKQLSDEIQAGGPRAYNGGFWQQKATANVAAQIVHNGIPALLWTGWKATEVAGVLDEYAIFQNTYAGRPAQAPMVAGQHTTGRYQMIVGSGAHGSGLDNALALEWFDHWIKHEDNAIDQTSTPMHLYEQQSDRWTNASLYPMVSTYTPYYLATGGKLSTAAPTTTTTEKVTWGYPSQSGTSLTYSSPALTQATTLGGPIAATIYASSTNTNLELIATLFDVSPGGSTQEISQGALLGSLRAVDQQSSWYDTAGRMVRPQHPYAADEYLTPGKATRFDIKLEPTLWALKAGHSLKLVVNTELDPKSKECTISLANGLPQPQPCLLTAPQKKTLPGGVYTITASTSLPSAINLPLMSPSALPTIRSAATTTSESHATEPLDWGTISTTASPKKATSSSLAWIWIPIGIGIAGLLIVGAILIRRSRST